MAKNVTKFTLIQELAKKSDLSQAKAREVLDNLLDIIVENVADGHDVALQNFGTFKNQERAARQGRNPQTGEAIKIPARHVPVFHAGKAFKDTVKG